MNINFSFDEKNVQVGFENQFVVKDFTNKTLVKLLMLKGEKGDAASSEWGNITGSITNQTDLSNALNNKADTTDIPTDLNQLSNTTTKFVNETQLQAAITSLGSIFTLKGSVATVNDLPSQNNNIGDVYYVVSESAGYIWIDDDSTLRWEQLGMTVDTSDFLTKSGLLSSTGNSTTNTMHQSAITAALYNKADTTDIPTKTSDLTNDSGFITTETDPVFTNSVAHEITSTDITNWNNKSTFSGNYNDLTNKPTIPDELSDLSDDSTHRLVTDTEKSTWNAKSDFSGSYTDLTNKPNIPTKTSDLTNDSGFVTSNYHDSTKQDTLVSGQNIKTINGSSVLGSGDLTIDTGTNNYNNLSNKPSINGVVLEGNKTSEDLGIDILSQNVLYENTSGSNSKITLSDSASNYEYLEIFFRNNDNIYNSVKVYQPNGKKVNLISQYNNGSNTIWFKIAICLISGNTITKDNAVEMKLAASNAITASSGNSNYITRVIGYK